jgi:hypothetical protein
LRNTSVAIVMSSVSWPSFLKNFPNGHLVVGIAVDVGADEIGSRRLRSLRDLLRQVIDGLASSGAFALTVSRVAGFPEILCAFESEADAKLLARLAGATPAEGYPGFSSQHVFRLDALLESALRAGLMSKGDIDQR